MFKFSLKKFLSCKLGLIICFPIVIGYGQFNSPLTDAFTQGLGGASTAVFSTGTVIESNPALLSNPYLLEEGKFLNFSATVFPRLSPVENLTLLSTMGALIVNTEIFGTIGVSYNGLFSGTDVKSYYTETQLNIGYTYDIFKLIKYDIFKMVKVGTSIHWRSFGVSEELSTVQANAYLNLTVGLAINPIKNLTIGVVGQNVFEISFDNISFDNISFDDFSWATLENPLLARKIRVGAKYVFSEEEATMESFASLDFAYNLDDPQLDIYLGGQSLLVDFLQMDDFLWSDFLLVRGGVHLKNVVNEFSNFTVPDTLLTVITPSVGVGFNYSSFSVDYAFSYPLVFIGSVGNHIVSLAYKF